MDKKQLSDGEIVNTTGAPLESLHNTSPNEQLLNITKSIPLDTLENMTANEDLSNATIDFDTWESTKTLKEEFVSRTMGTVTSEIFLVALLTLFSFALYALFRIFVKRVKWEATAHKYGFIVENLLIVVPMLLAFTVFANDLLALNLFFIFVISCLLHYLCGHCYTRFISRLWNCKDGDMRQTYLTNYKANIQLTTAICILAVDFHVFPRRFAKAEIYGVGMMDMAVGTIIFSHALTSRHARVHTAVTVQNILANLKSSAILIGLGVARSVLLKELKYQEHVIEYGTHWNFFFTIAITKPLANIILFIFNCSNRQPLFLCLSVVTMVTYQASLSLYGIEEIIQNGFHGDKTRSNIIDANREGIFSCIGYLGLYFCGLFFGRQLFKKSHSLYNKLFWLGCWFVSGYFCMVVSVAFVTPISRQMANISYYFIQIAFNSLLLFGFILIDMVCFAAHSLLFRKQERVVEQCALPISFLARAVSRNLLSYFLVANILTGMVNLLFDTLHCSVLKSLAILVSYIVLLNNIIWTLFVIQNPYAGKME